MRRGTGLLRRVGIARLWPASAVICVSENPDCSGRYACRSRQSPGENEDESLLVGTVCRLASDYTKRCRENTQSPAGSWADLCGDSSLRQTVSKNRVAGVGYQRLWCTRFACKRTTLHLHGQGPRSPSRHHLLPRSLRVVRQSAFCRACNDGRVDQRLDREHRAVDRRECLLARPVT